jgi:hypothetical protein
MGGDRARKPRQRSANLRRRLDVGHRSAQPNLLHWSGGRVCSVVRGEIDWR